MAATTGTVAGDTPQLMKPMSACFDAAREAMSKEMNMDPAPEFPCEQIVETTEWLKSVLEAMQMHNDGFTKHGLANLDDEALQRNQALARESSRRLTLLFADASAKFGSERFESQLVTFGTGCQSKEIRQKLADFVNFFERFGQAKWLGDLVAPEFKKHKENAMNLLKALQNPSQTVLPVASWCARCGKISTRVLGFCQDCNFCACGYKRGSYPQGCPKGCNVTELATLVPVPVANVVPGSEPRIYDDISSEGNTSAAELMKLARMAEAFAAACRADSEARAKADALLVEKMSALKAFAEVMSEVPDMFRRFVLLCLGSVKEDAQMLKAWVGHDEATAVHQQLEAFRDHAAEEKVIRRIKSQGGTSSASSWILASPCPSDPNSEASHSSSRRAQKG